MQAIEDSMRKPKKRTKRATVAAVEPLAHKISNAALLLDCGRTLIYDEVNRGNLDLVKVGRASRITDESIRRLLAGRQGA
jgi:hypothetical protein